MKKIVSTLGLLLLLVLSACGGGETTPTALPDQPITTATSAPPESTPEPEATAEATPAAP